MATAAALDPNDIVATYQSQITRENAEAILSAILGERNAREWQNTIFAVDGENNLVETSIPDCVAGKQKIVVALLTEDIKSHGEYFGIKMLEPDLAWNDVKVGDDVTELWEEVLEELTDVHEVQKDDVSLYTITAEKIGIGLSKSAEKWGGWDWDGLDANTAEHIVQVAMCGSSVYG